MVVDSGSMFGLSTCCNVVSLFISGDQSEHGAWFAGGSFEITPRVLGLQDHLDRSGAQLTEHGVSSISCLNNWYSFGGEELSK